MFSLRLSRGGVPVQAAGGVVCGTCYLFSGRRGSKKTSLLSSQEEGSAEGRGWCGLVLVNSQDAHQRANARSRNSSLS